MYVNRILLPLLQSKRILDDTFSPPLHPRWISTPKAFIHSYDVVSGAFAPRGNE